MRVQLFKNMSGLVYGGDPKRIGCDREGVLKIGTTEINITPNEDAILPLLFNGCSGDYRATFTDKLGQVFELEKVAVRAGRIAPPSATAVELMELRLRADEAEDKIRELEGIFDTNSLNFLIK